MKVAGNFAEYHIFQARIGFFLAGLIEYDHQDLSLIHI